MIRNTEFESYVEEWWNDFAQDIFDKLEEDSSFKKTYRNICEKLGVSNIDDLQDGLEIYQKIILHNPGFSNIPSAYDFISEFIEDNYNIEYDFQWDLLEDIVQHIIGYEDPKRFFKDISYGGCKSGLIGMFIYNSDCKKFYIDNIDGMEDYFKSLEDELGIKINNGDDTPRYTFVCWVCYEEFCRQLSSLFE